MSSRTRTIASFFVLAMGMMLFGAFVTAQIQKPGPVRAAAAEEQQAAAAAGGRQAIVGLDTFRDVARRQTAGVVNINTRKTVKTGGRTPFHNFDDDLLERFFGRRGESETQRSLGSGFVIDKDGYILTNRHVVDGADEIRITLSDGQEYDAKLVGRDARTDVALLKIEPKKALTVLELGDSDQTEPGEWVMAIGNPFGLGGNSVTVGVVSYKGRPLTVGTRGTSVDMIQTDAAINPGNSGGPLLDTRGRVIGINTMIITRGLPQSAGVGFAVPINVAKEILPQLRTKGKVERGWLGVTIAPMTEDLAKTFKMAEARGAIVNDVTAGSPAEKAGVQADDVILALDGKAMADNNEVVRTIAGKAPGTTVRLKLLREGKERDVTVTLGAFPEEGDAADEPEAERARLGMTLQDLSPDMARRLDLPRGARGVLVVRIEPGEAAEDAGLAQGDLILSVNGSGVATVDEFFEAIEAARGDGVARVRVRRGDTAFTTVLKLD